MNEQDKQGTTTFSREPRAKLLEGLKPFYYRNVDEPYPQISMIKALTCLLVYSRDGHVVENGDHIFPIDNDDICWLLCLIGDLADEIKKNVDAIFDDTRVVWKELEQRALNLEQHLASLNERPGNGRGLSG